MASRIRHHRTAVCLPLVLLRSPPIKHGLRCGQMLLVQFLAEALVISEWTVDTHVRHILTKLGLRSRAQVAAWAIERRLLETDS